MMFLRLRPQQHPSRPGHGHSPQRSRHDNLRRHNSTPSRPQPQRCGRHLLLLTFKNFASRSPIWISSSRSSRPNCRSNGSTIRRSKPKYAHSRTWNNSKRLPIPPDPHFEHSCSPLTGLRIQPGKRDHPFPVCKQTKPSITHRSRRRYGAR